jgi:hypothetical protein
MKHAVLLDEPLFQPVRRLVLLAKPLVELAKRFVFLDE